MPLTKYWSCHRELRKSTRTTVVEDASSLLKSGRLDTSPVVSARDRSEFRPALTTNTEICCGLPRSNNAKSSLVRSDNGPVAVADDHIHQHQTPAGTEVRLLLCERESSDGKADKNFPAAHPIHPPTSQGFPHLSGPLQLCFTSDLDGVIRPALSRLEAEPRRIVSIPAPPVPAQPEYTRIGPVTSENVINIT